MALLYKGYAQQKGFGANLVNIPDPSKKIREQGLTTIAHMKDQMEWDKRQAQRFSNAMQRNFELERQNADDNFRLRSLYSEKVAGQKWRNFEQLIRNDETKFQNHKNNIKDLLALTKTGAKLWEAYDAKQKETADLFAHQLKDEHGLGWSKINKLRETEDTLWNDQARREELIRSMGLEGVPKDVIDRVRNISGYKQVAVQKLHARNYARGASAYYGEHWNTKVELPGVGEVDLASATASQVDTVIQLLDKKRRQEAGNGAPSAKMMGLSGAYEIAETQRGQIRYQKTRQLTQDAVEGQHQDEKDLLRDAIDTNYTGRRSFGAGVNQLVHMYAGGWDAKGKSLVSARKRVSKAIIDGLQKGDISWEEARTLGDYKVPGLNNTWGNLFKNDWIAIQNAGLQSLKQEYARNNMDLFAHEQKGKRFLAEAIDLANEQQDPKTWTKLLSIANKNNWKEASHYIASRLTRGQNFANDEAGLSEVQSRINAGEYLSKEEIDVLGMTPEANVQAYELMNNHNPFLPKAGGYDTELEDTVDKLLYNRIPKKVTGNNNITHGMAKRAALTKANTRYKALVQSGMSHADAYDKTLSYITGTIMDPKGLFEPRMNKHTNNMEFSGFSPTVSSEDMLLNTEQLDIADDLIKNPSLISSRSYISETALSTKAAQLQSGKYKPLLPRSVFIQHETKNGIEALDAEISQIDFYNAKRKAEGKPLIPPYPKEYVNRVRAAYGGISPKAQRLLNKYDYSQVNRAAMESGMNPIYDRPQLEKARELLSTNEDWNKTEAGNSVDTLGFDLTGTTIREILILQRDGQLTAAGRYGLDSESILAVVDEAGVDLDDNFDADTQNKLLDATFKLRGPEFIKNIQNPKDRLLMESLYETVTQPKYNSKYGGHNPALLRTEAFAALYEGGRYE